MIFIFIKVTLFRFFSVNVLSIIIKCNLYFNNGISVFLLALSLLLFASLTFLFFYFKFITQWKHIYKKLFLHNQFN